MHRPHIDDAAAFLPVHLPQGGTGREEGSVQMDRKQLPPLLELELDERRNALDASVADKDVEPSEGFDRPCHSAFHLLLAADIHAHPERAFTRRVDPGRRLLGRTLIEGKG